MKMKFSDLPDMLKQTANGFMEAKATRLGAGLAYYTIFSMAPLLVIVIAIAALVFGHDQAANGIKSQFDQLAGPAAGDAVKTMLSSGADHPKAGLFATVIGIVTLLFGASGVFVSLQDALDTIWGVAPKPDRGIMGIIMDRVLSFSMVMGICFLLLVSLVVSTVLSAAGHFMNGMMPGMHYVWWGVNIVVSIAAITLLFAMMFKFLPDAKIAWSDVWVGAVVTAVLFTIGKTLIGMYLGKASVGSAYGAAGSLVALLVWIYYSTLILFFGAEFAKVYAERFGSNVVPSENAVALTDEMRNAQGMPTNKALDRANKGEPAKGAPVTPGAAAVAYDDDDGGGRNRPPRRPREVVPVGQDASMTTLYPGGIGNKLRRNPTLLGALAGVGGLAAGVLVEAIRSRHARVNARMARAMHLKERIDTVEDRFEAARRAMESLPDKRISRRALDAAREEAMRRREQMRRRHEVPVAVEQEARETAAAGGRFPLPPEED